MAKFCLVITDPWDRTIHESILKADSWDEALRKSYRIMTRRTTDHPPIHKIELWRKRREYGRDRLL